MTSKKKASKYIIGIDLGTTNCTLAYIKKDDDSAAIQQFLIPQITRDGEEESLPYLPSFIYFPLEEELKSQGQGISWDKERTFAVGKYAKARGEDCPDRVISSAKSWLCHYGIDRRKKWLPMAFEKESSALSPVEAIKEILSHLKEAWNSSMDHPFLEQEIFITVPASFDPSAKQLVEEAAKLAGFTSQILLEEPQAAFYSWLYRQKDTWREKLQVGDKILVVDIGGGTTDFSLIQVEEKDGSLSLERVAVGSHLLLGGDNLDYALAYYIKDELENQNKVIDDWQFQALKASASHAKEILLSDKDKEMVPITIMGRGSRLIGGAIKFELKKSVVEDLLVNGFFPSIGFENQALNERQMAFQEKGLPFARDARVTSQLASFLAMQSNNEEENSLFPTALLFNGGTMKAEAFRDRLHSVLNDWAASFGKPKIKLLGDEDYDFAVSSGAVYYGLAIKGKGVRIRSSLSQSYFIGIEEAIPAIPGREPPLKALCIAPYGMEEGSHEILANQEFALTLGKKVFFRFFSSNGLKSTSGNPPKMGSFIKNWKKDLIELHPIETKLGDEEEEEKMVFVTLKASFTPLGSLELSCQESDKRSWVLEFDLRKEEEKAKVG